MIRSTDYDIRQAVVANLLEHGVARKNIRHEITLDTSSSDGRLDILVLNPRRLVAIEVKSGRDKLDRLKQQRKAAERAVDYFLVASDVRHREKMWWSQVVWWHHDERQLRMGYTHSLVQPINWCSADRTNVPAMARLLWRDEAVAAAQRIAEAGCGHKTRVAAISWMKEQARLSDLRPLVAELIAARPLNRWEEAFWQRFDQKSKEAA